MNFANWLTGLAGTLVLAFSLGSAAHAAIIDVTGQGGVLGSSPADLRSGESESSLIQGFDEDQGIFIGQGSLRVNYLNPNGSYGGTDAAGPFLPEGWYDSHILHYDPFGDSGGQTGSITAKFTFSNRIAGIVTSVGLLDASDFLGTGFTYDTGSAGRRTEDTDTFTVNGNTLTATFFSTGNAWTDQLRVITVPEPNVLMLMLLGTLGLAVARARSKA